MAERDGFIIRDENGVEQHFMACSQNGSMRDRAANGLLRKLIEAGRDWTFEDTRDEVE